MHQGQVRLDICKDFFFRRVVKHRSRLPGAAIEAPSLEVFRKYFKRCLKDFGLRDMV